MPVDLSTKDWLVDLLEEALERFDPAAGPDWLPAGLVAAAAGKDLAPGAKVLVARSLRLRKLAAGETTPEEAFVEEVRGHLGLVVPPGCFIRVGPDERTWEEGKMMVFDDSFEHEVWNHSDFVRIVLFMNFWHPCFADREIPVLERFRAAYERGPLSRVHADNQAAKRAHDLEVRVPQKAQVA